MLKVPPRSSMGRRANYLSLHIYLLTLVLSYKHLAIGEPTVPSSSPGITTTSPNPINATNATTTLAASNTTKAPGTLAPWIYIAIGLGLAAGVIAVILTVSLRVYLLKKRKRLQILMKEKASTESPDQMLREDTEDIESAVGETETLQEDSDSEEYLIPEPLWTTSPPTVTVTKTASKATSKAASKAASKIAEKQQSDSGRSFNHREVDNLVIEPDPAPIDSHDTTPDEAIEDEADENGREYENFTPPPTALKDKKGSSPLGASQDNVYENFSVGAVESPYENIPLNQKRQKERL